MKQEILLARTEGESRGAVLAGGMLTDYRRATRQVPSLVGGIYRGRILKRVAGLAGAIAEIPGGQAWLDLGRGARETAREGAAVALQIVQDAQGGKLARASLELAVAGRFLAFRPGAAKPALSHRLVDNDVRAHLGVLLPKLAAAGEGAFLAFHRAAAASDDMLRAEAARLLQRWRDAAAGATDGPGTMLAPADPAFDLLRVFVGAETARIAVDSEALAAAVRAWRDAEAPDWPGIVAREPVGRTTLDSETVRAALEAALAPEIDLPGGGVLAFGCAAGLAAIDVDTDRAAGLSAKATFAGVNREAAREIGRQIRLRNLGGRIVVDFAGLGAGRDLPGALAVLRHAVAADPMAVRIARPSEFGLVELLRRRERRTLAEMLGIG